MKQLAAAIVALVCGCGAITNPSGPEYPKDESPKNGYEYCQMISDSARVRASRTAVYGWTSMVLGASSTALGVAFPLAKSDPLEFKQKMGTSALAFGGAALFLIGQAVLKRSDAASKLAGETVSVIGERVDSGGKKVPISADEAGAKCSVALGAWETSRSDATALAGKLLANEKAEKKEADNKAADADAKKSDAEAKTKDAEKKQKDLKNEVQELLRTCGPKLNCTEQQVIDIQQKLLQ